MFLTPRQPREKARPRARGPLGRARLIESPLGVRVLGTVLALTTIWAGGATYYLVFHDEVLARFVSQQSTMQYGYEARIAALERLVGRQALELEYLKGALRNGPLPRSGPTSVITGPAASLSPRDAG